MNFRLLFFPVLIFQTGIILISCETNDDAFFRKRALIKEPSLQEIVNEVTAENTSITVSLRCALQLNALKRNPYRFFKMADAWSKFPYTGLLAASRNDYGNYDECISVEINDVVSGKILGKHCTYGLVIPDFTVTNQSEMIENAWKLSYCIPDACTAQDLVNATGLPIFNDAICSTKETDTELDFGALITLCLLVSFILIMVVSTIHDVYLYYNKKKNSNPISIAFSIFSNGKKLVTFAKHSQEHILCFHGIKFISIWWIMAGHGVIAWQNVPVMNADFRSQWSTSRSSAYIMRAHLAVDSFFFISGFLFAYLYFKQDISKRSLWTQVKAVPSLILHRYLRLTPAVLMTYLFVVYLDKYIGNGPLYSYYVDDLTKPCKKYWWAVFLYFQNYYVYHLEGGLCITPLWYLCADMHLFLISPVIIIPIAMLYRRSFKTALAALTGINVLFIALPIFTKLTWRDYDPNFDEYDSHSRLTDYFIGVMMGIYMRHEKHKRYRYKTVTNFIIWITVLGAMFGVILITQEITLNHGYLAKTLGLSFTRPVWCLCLCWITFACVTGRGGIVNWLLSSSFMQLGGKLTYCMYLVHGPIITDFAISVKDRKLVSDWYMFYYWCGHFIISMLIATFWTLAFELPMISIEKLVFRLGAVAVPKKQTSTEERQENH